MLSPTLYRYEMTQSWKSDAAAVEALYSLKRFDGNTNAAYIQPDGDAGVVCPTMEVARKVTAAGGSAYVFHWAYKGCSDSHSRLKLPADYASHASEIPYVFGVDPGCYTNEKEKRLTKAMQEYWGSCAYPKCPSQHPLPVAALARCPC